MSDPDTAQQLQRACQLARPVIRRELALYLRYLTIDCPPEGLDRMVWDNIAPLIDALEALDAALGPTRDEWTGTLETCLPHRPGRLPAVEEGAQFQCPPSSNTVTTPP